LSGSAHAAGENPAAESAVKRAVRAALMPPSASSSSFANTTCAG
jgi:hypothetical protein